MSEENYVLVLYVVGKSYASEAALTNIKQICEENAQGRYSIEIVDLVEQPALAERDQIFAVPTLVRREPMPLRKLIGDLSDHRKVIAALGMNPALSN
jgi:circadian clock protein KaiB